MKDIAGTYLRGMINESRLKLYKDSQLPNAQYKIKKNQCTTGWTSCICNTKPVREKTMTISKREISEKRKVSKITLTGHHAT